MHFLSQAQVDKVSLDHTVSCVTHQVTCNNGYRSVEPEVVVHQLFPEQLVPAGIVPVLAHFPDLQQVLVV